MKTTDIFDDYLDARLSGEDSAAFEQRLKEDVLFARSFDEHRKMVEAMKSLQEKEQIRKTLASIHEKEFGSQGRVIGLNREETFARRHGKTIAVAASTAFIAVLSTVAILSTGGYLLKQQSNQITDLNRVVMELKASSNAIVEGITKGSKKIVYAPANLEGTAFALNNKGYIVTSFHVVKGADSIFVQNKNTERSLTRLVFTDPSIDLAVLKIENENIHRNWQVPFVIKSKTADIGDKVFTLGYPRKDMVYGEGSLSSQSGYYNDTSMYQISIPVNPGNSGGPLLDDNGNVIGVIRGKISGAEATGFAIKTEELLHAINATAGDSLKRQLTSFQRKPVLRKLKRSEQVKKINPYVFNVLVYKKD